MRYSADHKEETRRRIVEAAASTAKKHGFGTTGVDGLMGAAGLKGSSFYHHFDTKNDLLREIIEVEMEATRKRYTVTSDASKDDLLKQTLAYLSVQHVESPHDGCVLPALSAEIARANNEVKQSYESSIERIHSEINAVLGDGETTWALLAMSIGAVTMARAMPNKECQEKVLKACRTIAERTFNSLGD